MMHDRDIDEVTILLAEDSAFSVRSFKRKLRQWTQPHRIVVAKDGQVAMDLLDPDSPLQMDPLPDLLLLDLNMPRVGGLEVLSFIRSMPTLAELPVAIMTTSDSVEDMDMAFALDTEDYLIKGVSDNAICTMMNRLLNQVDDQLFERELSALGN